ncbi:hypothetical protein P4133_21945 [Pseudomonas aeruginosa]|nr:hypothetical protein [Pseudomonas aeruginosa]MDF5908525.1 hypothetical protein [Pseudomonas aeruginosa]MDF5921153.1 hypothetical protein [Pseudomonas aeruginosa]MDF5998034.1 hypothetical protein [Pseudomonas aeruginosa]MDW0130705.1 hypothetical protein [Pseudomonas aeruginosa]
MNILITHNRDLLKNFFSARAVTTLQGLGNVRLNDSDEPLRGDALVAAAKDCQVIISDRLAPGEALVFAGLPNLLAFCAARWMRAMSMCQQLVLQASWRCVAAQVTPRPVVSWPWV